MWFLITCVLSVSAYRTSFRPKTFQTYDSLQHQLNTAHVESHYNIFNRPRDSTTNLYNKEKSPNQLYTEEIDLSNLNDEDFDDDQDESFSIINPEQSIRNDYEWMFFDVARINVKGGDGGDGCMAMRREFKVDMGGPCGGNGGHGGSIYLECDDTLNTLSLLRRHVHHKAEDGTNGRGKSCHGEKGEDIVIPVPPGTIVRDQNNVLAGELNTHGQRLLVARGGKGGRGNEHFKTPRNTAPSFCERGETGTERWLNIELKLVADVGFVGVPNAGKSTLLASCSNAKPKIADYPFTTVVPNLGVCDIDDDLTSSGKGLVLVDIPGLLEGAHTGKGLGLAFLRHVQRCRVVIHLIRGDSEDPINDFVAINQELELFNPKLANMTQVVVVNKIDIPEVREKAIKELIPQLRRICGHSRVMMISAATRENVPELMKRVKKLVDSLPKQNDYSLFTEEENRVNFEDEDTEDFDILTDERFPNQFRVVGTKIEKTVQVMNWDYTESLKRFQRILEAQGISEALSNLGAKQGDLVMIGDWDFYYIDKKNQWISNYDIGEETKPQHRPVYYNAKK